MSSYPQGGHFVRLCLLRSEGGSKRSKLTEVKSERQLRETAPEPYTLRDPGTLMKYNLQADFEYILHDEAVEVAGHPSCMLGEACIVAFNQSVDALWDHPKGFSVH